MIKYFESSDAGAPTLNNAAGSMIAVLDACLITGYNSKAVTSITVASGVATVVCAAHGFSNTYGKGIRIAGATPATLNKDTPIANVTTNGFTYLCPGVADGVATGTITAKYAPLDWVKQYSDTNKAMYKRGDVTATGCMLRVKDDVAGQYARVLMVGSATDIDTYTNPTPTTTQQADGLGQFWAKGDGGASATTWFIVADDVYFYLFVSSPGSLTGFVAHAFGDITSFKPGDVLNCILAGATQGGGQASPFYGAIYYGNCFLIQGGKSGVTTAQTLICQAKIAPYGNDGPVYPSDIDGGLVISYPILVSESAGAGSLRGIVPGLAVPLANIGTTFTTKAIISNLIGSSRIFLVVPCAPSPGGGVIHIPLIDLTGPWR